MGYLQIVYASSATQPVEESFLHELLNVSRKNNGALGITGILLCVDGSFLQVLEGPAENVDSLYEQISFDRRHGAVVLLLRREVEERGFGDWTMGYVNVTRDSANFEGLFDLLRDKPFAALKGDHRRIKSVLDGFIKGRWRKNIS